MFRILLNKKNVFKITGLSTAKRFYEIKHLEAQSLALAPNSQWHQNKDQGSKQNYWKKIFKSLFIFFCFAKNKRSKLH